MTDVEIRNLTPHRVAWWQDGQVVATWPPAGQMARLVEMVSEDGLVATPEGDLPVSEVAYQQEVSGLPSRRTGVVYLVSRVLAQAVDRDDLYFPYPEIRDADGAIVGCGGLGRFRHPI